MFVVFGMPTGKAWVVVQGGTRILAHAPMDDAQDSCRLFSLDDLEMPRPADASSPPGEPLPSGTAV